MPVAKKLLDILVCPETHQRVELAPEPVVRDLNQRIRSGSVVNHRGDKVSEELREGLLRTDGKALYPIRDDIPVMLIDERIDLT